MTSDRRVVGVGVEELGPELGQRVDVREPLAQLREVAAGGGPAVGVGEQRGGEPVAVGRERVELEQAAQVGEGGGVVGPDAGDAGGGRMPRGRRGERPGGGEVGVGLGEPAAVGVALGAEQEQVAEGGVRANPERSARGLSLTPSLRSGFAGANIGTTSPPASSFSIAWSSAANACVRLVAVDQRVEQCPHRRRVTAPPPGSPSAGTAAAPPGPCRCTAAARSTLGELVLAVVQARGEPVQLGRVVEPLRAPTTASPSR